MRGQRRKEEIFTGVQQVPWQEGKRKNCQKKANGIRKIERKIQIKEGKISRTEEANSQLSFFVISPTEQSEVGLY